MTVRRGRKEGGTPGSYDDWTVGDLKKRAKHDDV
jgi:hypothetical protein